MEEILIPAIVFSFVLLIIKMSLDHAKWKAANASGTASGDKSLTTSELQEIVREAVQDATGDLSRRVEELESFRSARAAGVSEEVSGQVYETGSSRPEPRVGS